MRASDSDRDRVADQLREALAEGRLNAEEHAERLDAVYQAKTYAELAPIVHDLPATGGIGPPEGPPGASASGGPIVRDDLPPPHAGTPNIVAIFGGASRSGRWLVEPATNVVAVFGGIELDLRQAVLTRREVTINVVAIMSGVNLTVPPGVRVVNSVAAILGDVSVPPEETIDPDAPVIRLTGFALLSGVSVRRRATGDGTLGGADRRETHHEQRRLHRESREERRELRRRHRR
jgi:hypothetical protein